MKRFESQLSYRCGVQVAVLERLDVDDVVGSDPPLAFVLQPPSGLRAIAQIDHSIGKTALVHEIQLCPYVAGQDPPAAANHHRHDEQMILVDKPGSDRVCREGRTPH